MVNNGQAVEFFAKAKESLDQFIDLDSNYDSDNYAGIKKLQGYTPLHCAIKYSSVQAANILLQYGADVNIKDGKGMSCVHLLIERIVTTTDFITMGKRALLMPCVEEIERLECIVKLVLKTTTVNESGLSTLHLACTLSDKSIVEHYLKQSVDVNVPVNNESEFWPGWTPLHFAACLHVDMVLLLIQYGADITMKNSKGETALDLCARRFSLTDIQLVLSMKKEFKEILLSDNCTKLSDLLLVMNDLDKFSAYLQKLKDVNLIIPLNSPIWAGYNLLHLSVSLNEKKINCKNTIRFELPEATKSNFDLYNCTEEEEAFYWKRIELCLEFGCSASMKNAKGQTPIHLAFNVLSKATMKKLLKYCDDNVADQNNMSHLHVACAIGDLDAVKRYLRKGANVNSQVRISFDLTQEEWLGGETTINVRENSTPLHVAVAFGHDEIIEYLLENNADVYAKDSLDLTPVHLAMSRLRNSESEGFARLFYEMIPDLRNSVSKAGLSHLHVAVRANDGKAVTRMLLEGAEVDCVVDATVKEPHFLAKLAGKTPLRIAAGESEEAIMPLLEAGANIHAQDLKGISVIQHSIEKLDYPWTLPLVQMLKDGKCDIASSGITLLHFACGTYDVEWARKLLENGADVNARISAKGDFQGATPLHLMFVPTNTCDIDPQIVVSLVNLLLDNGADVTIQRTCGNTPIHLIYEEMIDYEHFYMGEKTNREFLAGLGDLLLESQQFYSVNTISRRGFTHFHYACVRNKVKTVKKFLDHGADVNQSYYPLESEIGGFTPLHFAMAYGSSDVAYLLLDRGADVSAEDAHGNKPLQVGIKRNFVDFSLIETILSHGADINDENLMEETLFYCLLKYGGLTLEALEFFFKHGCFIKNILETHQEILGSAMLSVAEDEFQPFLERLSQVREVKSAIQNGFNIIQSIVAVEHEGEITLENYLSSIQFLMSIGCELDQQDAKGKAALHTATSFFNLEAVDALLQLGADVNLIDYWNQYPFSNKAIAFIYFSSSDPRDRNFMKTLVGHLWKMKFIGLDVNNSNLKYIGKHEKQIPFYKTLKKSCKNELKKAKKTKIIQFLTVKDFLSEIGAVRRYPMLCSELRCIVDKFFKCTVTLRREFPEFSGLLAMQYKKACTRLELLQPARKAIISICQFHLPDLCLEAILGYFTNNEMKTVIASAKELFD